MTFGFAGAVAPAERREAGGRRRYQRVIDR
jgi:hypothetical protein